MSPYFYRKGASGLGIGVDDLAFQSLAGKPVFGPYSRGYVPERALTVQAPGFVKMQQRYIPVGLVGNGVELSGRIALQRLAQMTKAS